MGAVRTTLTMEEFLALPELPSGKRELLRGELIDLPPAKKRHSRIAHRLQKVLDALVWTIAPGCEVYLETGYRLGPRHWFQPDLSITQPDQPGDDYFEGSPLLAVEIVSPSNTAAQIAEKIEDYHHYGAQEVWVLYPDQRHLWVYSAEISAQRYTGTFVSQLLNGESIDLDAIFAD